VLDDRARLLAEGIFVHLTVPRKRTKAKPDARGTGIGPRSRAVISNDVIAICSWPPTLVAAHIDAGLLFAYSPATDLLGIVKRLLERAANLCVMLASPSRLRLLWETCVRWR
jgi:hypothetical protein